MSRYLPAQQGFRANDATAGQIKLRLEVQHKLIALKCVAQTAFHLEALQ